MPSLCDRAVILVRPSLCLLLHPPRGNVITRARDNETHTFLYIYLHIPIFCCTFATSFDINPREASRDNILTKHYYYFASTESVGNFNGYRTQEIILQKHSRKDVFLTTDSSVYTFSVNYLGEIKASFPTLPC